MEQNIKSSSLADSSLVTISTISYALLLIVAIAALIPGLQISLALLFVALILDIIKFSDSRNTWQEAHFRWRLRSVVIAAILYVVTTPLIFLFILPYLFAWGLISLWFLYRMVLGLIAFNQHREPKGYFS